jgi:hypothetical protein
MKNWKGFGGIRCDLIKANIFFSLRNHSNLGNCMAYFIGVLGKQTFCLSWS